MFSVPILLNMIAINNKLSQNCLDCQYIVLVDSSRSDHLAQKWMINIVDEKPLCQHFVINSL